MIILVLGFILWLVLFVIAVLAMLRPQEKSQKEYERKWKASPLNQLSLAREEIVQLKRRIAELEAEIAEN